MLSRARASAALHDATMMDWILVGLLIAAILFAIARGIPLPGRKQRGASPAQAPAPAASQAKAPSTPHQLADSLRAFYESTSHPQDLLGHPAFEAGAARLADPSTPLEQVVIYCTGANHQLAAMAAEALSRRPDGADAVERVVAHLRIANVWTMYYALRFLQAHARTPIVGRVLVGVQQWWSRNPFLPRMMSEFIAARAASGEQPSLRDALAAKADTDLDDLQAFVDTLQGPAGAQLSAELAQWRRERLDTSFLNSVGRLWSATDIAAPIVEHAELRAALQVLLDAVLATPPQPVLVTGEPGVGKSVLIRLLARNLAERGWAFFEASAADILSGQSFIGELEKRLRELTTQLATGRRVVWYAPNFHELVYAGRHRYSPIGVLELMLPAIEAGRLCVIGELPGAALERLVQERPRLRVAFKELHLEPLSAAQTLELADALLDREFKPAGVVVEPAVLKEAMELARHYLDHSAMPGALIELLRATKSRLTGASAEPVTVTRDALFLTLAHLTGLPRSLLDEREGLDPRALREFFQQRVMGQPEAMACLVDRVAMLKAGLTDPLRPIGVFLFAGPTGTGKTEVAKTLARFMFGSPDRMIRLDMSEFQEPGSLARIVGEGGEMAAVDSLAHRVRKQPFCVVLLDEFEKANARVWDLFLQVFDDGRLTDAQGSLADFRHSIIILTTNLGATEHRGASLGFNPVSGAFSDQQVVRVISETFRPEFVNRIDRVVVFRPLSRAVMREILKKELRDLLQRRGFRNREWAVEWEESALEFLLDKGFTPDMGARPLRRAIEQYLLAPLAMTIVEHRFPEGDQFLFVRSDSTAIQVEFVDPDMPQAAPTSAEPESAGAPGITLGRLMLAANGTDSERRFVMERLAALDQRLTAEDWLASKEGLLAQLNRVGFWTSAERHSVLSRIELMDRVEAGAETARSLSRRLDARAQRHTPLPRQMLSNLAQQLYLLEGALADLDAGASSDVFLSVEPVAAELGAAQPDPGWPHILGGMYREWGRKRRMRVATLRDARSDSDAQLILLAISGFGAHHILSREAGLHILEVPDGSGGFHRQTARTRVVQQPLRPKPAQQSELDFALACLAAAGAGSNAVVRRYRQQPSPLVRDGVAGWRTGRLDLVLGGDFDLMQ